MNGGTVDQTTFLAIINWLMKDPNVNNKEAK